MRVLLASQYFPPEPGATQNRLGTFADGLADRGHDVAVVCEQPCHPGGVFEAGFGHRPQVTERRGRMTVHRLWVATSPEKTTARRVAFYGTFAAGAAARAATIRRPDVMFASSPPLPGVLTVAAVARARRIPLVVDVRDVWPAAAEALGELTNARVLRAFERAERWLYRSASAVTATTRPFCAHVDAVAGRDVSVHVPNGALDALVEAAPSPVPASSPFVVGYAGNLGIAQGMDIVLEAADRLRGTAVRFVLVGEGPVKAALVERARTLDLDNVEFRPGVPVDRIAAFLGDAHALLIPLRDHPLLEDFIPSKLYDAMAVGRPALVAARGEAAALVREHDAGLVVEPEDGAGLARAVSRLRDDPSLAERLGANGRRAAHGLSRSRQLDRLEATLVAAASA